MNCREFESRMADYLGEELPVDGCAECDAHLASCSTCRERVSDYQAVVRELQQLETVSPDVAAQQTAGLMVVRRPAAWRRIGGGILKAAAVLALGITIGRYSRTPEPTPKTDPSALAAASAAEIHPGWIELGRKVSPGSSSFAQHLAMLARTAQH